MKRLFIPYLIFLTISAKAEIIASKVFKILPEHNLLLLENGNALELNSLEIKDQLQERDKIHLNTKTKKITSLERNDDHITFSFKTFPFITEPPSFSPSVLENEEEAVKLFSQMRSDYKRMSECSDRAHVWSYDALIEKGILTQKIFIFFTASYINRVGFKWWFHVAPLVLIKNKDQIEERVLDFRYSEKPLPLKIWSDRMVFSHRPCKFTTKFSEYDVNPQTEDCYMIKENMYYRLPGDLSLQETHEVYRTKFFESEVRFSKRNAFETQN